MSSSRKSSPSGDSQVPRLHVAPRADSSDGDLAGAFSAAYELQPDPWQSFVLHDWLALYRGRWASLTAALAVPRQSGKNALLEMRELYGAVALGERILHTAHEVKTAQKHFRRLKHFFGDMADDPGAKFPELNALVERVRNVNGQEAIVLHNGGSIEVVARSKNSGRGFTVDVLVMDEAQELDEDALEALMPTTSAAPLGNPQWIFTGTPPGPAAHGEVFTRIRDEAMSEKPGRMCWHEWSAEEGADLDDREVWRATNPGLVSGRLQIEVIEGERARFSDDGFARERLGMWPAQGGSSRVVTAQQWSDSAIEVAPEGVPAYAVTFNLLGDRLALAGARKHDDGVHVEVIDALEDSRGVEGGLAALADWFCERGEDGKPRWRKSSGIALSGRAGAPALAQLLRDRGVPDRWIVIPSTPKYVDACSMWLEGVRGGTVTHKREGQSALDESVAVTDLDKRGGLAATVPDGDETPVEAVALAHWVARTSLLNAKRQTERKAKFL